MKELYMEYNQFMWIKKDRVMYYTEDELKFTLMMPIDGILLITEKFKSDLLDSNIPVSTFINTQLVRGFKVEERELEPMLEPIIPERTEYMVDKFVGWTFAGSRNWIIEYFKTYDFPLITNITDKQRKELKDMIIESFINNWAINVLQKKLFNLLEDENKVELILRTEIVRGMSESSLNRYEANGIKKVKWSAVMDIRTCKDCMANHGKEFTVKEARGKIPLHPQCRCCYLPVVE